MSLSELLQGTAMIGVLAQDGVQVLDGLGPLAIAEIDTGLGEELLGIARNLSSGFRLLELVVEILSQRDFFFVVGFEGRAVRELDDRLFGEIAAVGLLDLDVVVIQQIIGAETVFAQEVRLVSPSIVVPETDVGFEHRPSIEALTVHRNVPLDDLARLVFVPTLPVHLGEVLVRGCQIVVTAQGPVDVDQHLDVGDLVWLALDHLLDEGLGTIAVPSSEHQLRQRDHRRNSLRLDFENSLEHATGRIDLTLTHQFRLGFLVLGDAFADPPLLTQQVADLDPTGGIGRVERRHLAQEVERFALLAFLVVAVGRGLERLDRLGVETHALIEVGERNVGRVSIRIEIEDLLEDGDGAGVEAFIHVLVGDLGVAANRLVDLAPTPMRVTDLET